MFSINNQYISLNLSAFGTGNLENFNDEILDHLSPSKKLMLKIDKLAKQELDVLLEPVRRGEITLDELKRSRGLI